MWAEYILIHPVTDSTRTQTQEKQELTLLDEPVKQKLQLSGSAGSSHGRSFLGAGIFDWRSLYEEEFRK